MAPSRTVGVIGGGFAGGLFALKLAAARPRWSILLIESGDRPGRGLAYGACGPNHLLNVPVSRMEVGLEPRFEDWLRQQPDLPGDALAESGGMLADAFVTRRSFGDYMEQRIAEALAPQGGTGLRLVQAKAVSLAETPRQIMLANGRALPVDIAVLATGNIASRLPVEAKPSPRIIHDPWSPGALDHVAPGQNVLLVGSGLTMVDVIVSLRDRGHTGRICAVSRHGLLPKRHRAGQSWPAFLGETVSPREALHIIRTQTNAARRQGVPWQRVFDAARPAVASVWHRWSMGQRAQFLRHLRTPWDIHRHRMAGQVAAIVEQALESGRLTVRAGRILALDEHRDGITAVIRPRGGRIATLETGVVINCTGPQTDVRKTNHPLLSDMLRRGLIQPDPLGQGAESEDCAMVSGSGAISDWLFALGALTRPAWWEITAVPEITAQIDRLVRILCAENRKTERSLAAAFLDIGAGI